MERAINPVLKQLPPLVRPIVLGGTGASTPAAALSNLGGIASNKLGVANGIAPLDRGAKIPVIHFPALPDIDKPAIIGPLEVYTGQTEIEYTITNYDSAQAYVISLNRGTFTIDPGSNVIFFTPSNMTGIHILTINGKDYAINVVTPYAETPVITFPAANATGVSTHPTFTYEFVNHGLEYNLDDIMEWQVATDAAFTNIVDQYTANDSPSYSPSIALDISTEYYVRTRFYSGQILVYTNWSTTLHFTTTDKTFPNTLDEITPNDGYHRFDQLCISNDGHLLIARDNDIDYNPTISIHTDTANGTFQLVSTITKPLISDIIPSPVGTPSIVRWGYDYELSADKQRFFTPVHIDGTTDDLGSSCYRILVYKTVITDDYTEWELEQIVEPDLSSYGTGLLLSNIIWFEYHNFTVSADGSVLMIGCYNLNDDAGTLIDNTKNACVVVFTRNVSGIYEQTAIIADPGTSVEINGNVWYSGFGMSTQISDDGSQLVVYVNGIFVDWVGGSSNGSFYIFNRDVNGTYVLSHTWSSAVSADYVKRDFIISKDGSLIISEIYPNGGEYSQLLILEKIDNAWIETRISPPGWSSGGFLYGYLSDVCVNITNDLIIISSATSSTPYSYINLNNGYNDDTGYVYFYSKVDGDWIYQDILTNDNSNCFHANFGIALALSDTNVLAVGADGYYGFNNNWESSGAILIYK